jgi:cytolysin-activating lysine-acyltransferase
MDRAGGLKMDDGVSGAGGAEAQANADKTVSAVLGEIVWLMSQSPEFKQYLISDLEWLVMPPILLRQFRLFYHEGRPAGVVLYARVSPEVAARLDAGAPTLRPADWRSGDVMKVVKVIAPFGGGEEFLKQIVQDFR